jgi:hypothetical protein
MKRRWRLILPLCGLVYFALGTVHSERFNREERADGFSNRYHYWSVVRLDSDPLNRNPQPTQLRPCANGSDDCVSWRLPYIWIEPGILTQAYLWGHFRPMSLLLQVCASSLEWE